MTYLIKKITVAAIMLVMATAVFAVPAKRQWKKVTTASGEVMQMMMVGDEHGHWLVNEAGETFRMNSNGLAERLSADALDGIKSKAKVRADVANKRRAKRMESLRSKVSGKSTMHKVYGEPTHITGKKKGLVILVSYSDKDFVHNNADIDAQFNQVGYNKDNHIGSVHDYFYSQSYGQFDLEFDVIGPVKLSNTHDYYGDNDSDGNDKHPCEMVIEALRLADAAGVDFKKYDWDGNGEVDQVFILYAGTGEAGSSKDSDIWPHEWDLSSGKAYNDGEGAQFIDGVWIDTYAVSNEMADARKLNGIGTACHEFSHCLGYADLYDIDYSGGQGMMNWNLMDGGSYNGPNSIGEVPAGFTAYDRWWAGWMELTELKGYCKISDMPALEDEPMAYVIYNDANKNEFYVLENHQGKGWDSYCGCNGDGTAHGMLIIHIDYDKNVWLYNAPNDVPSHQRYTYFPADNNYGLSGLTYSQLKGDLFPGSKNITSFTDDTKPAATLYNKNTDGRKFMGKPITDISDVNGKISFTFGAMEKPVIESAKEAADGSVTVTWNAVEDAESYSLYVYQSKGADTQGALILDETFAKFKNLTSTSTDYATKLDNYTDNSGWLGKKVFQYSGYVKLGSSSASGFLTTPVVQAKQTGKLTIYTEAKKYDDRSANLMAYLCDTDGNQLGTTGSILNLNIGEDFTESAATFDCADECRISIYPNVNRWYLRAVKVFDGEFSVEDIKSGSANGKRLVSIKTDEDCTTISGITETSYTITDLAAGNYRIYLSYTRDGIESVNSAPVYVTVAEPTTIVALESGKENDTRIFNLNGQYVGNDINQLKTGIYIKGTRKVVVKAH